MTPLAIALLMLLGALLTLTVGALLLAILCALVESVIKTYRGAGS